MTKIKDLDNEQLLKLYRQYEGLIYVSQCYGINDLLFLSEIEREISLREGA